MGEVVRAFAAFQVRGWMRSRGPFLWAAFLAAWGWFNHEALEGGNSLPWWTGWSALAAWLGFLAGYDTYARMRETGTLRSLLLQPSPRAALALGSWAGATLIVGSALLLYLGFLALNRSLPPPAEVGMAVGLVLLTAAAFVSYAQLASLVLPKDTSAVLGLLVVVIGATPHDRWIPLGSPEWIEPIAQTLFLALPTSYRLSEALGRGGDFVTLATLGVQVTAPILVTLSLLGRPALLRRPDR